MTNHNHAAVWILVLFHQAFGFLWYAPFMFLDPYLEGRGITREQMNSSDPAPFVYGIIGAILTCYFISWLTRRMNVNNVREGLKTGLLLFAGLAFPAIAPHYKFLGIEDTVLWIDLGMSFLVLLVTCVVLAVWKKSPVQTVGR